MALRPFALIPVLATASWAFADTNACLDGEMAQFGRYVGDWRITDEQLSQDGKTWSPGQGARWTFECIGNGVAVQDYWMPNSGGWGTNLRTFNADTGGWEIVWAAQRQQGLMRISARQHEDGSIVMSVDHPPQPQPRRIIFFPPEETGWNWAMQWSLDKGRTWFDVYRMRAAHWEDS